MIEYRIEKWRGSHWELLKNSQGKYYTYADLATAKKRYLFHGDIMIDSKGKRKRDPSTVRIVWCDCDWKPV